MAKTSAKIICSDLTKRGTRCKSRAMNGKTKCHVHDPATQKKSVRVRKQRRADRADKKKATAEGVVDRAITTPIDAPIATYDDLITFIGESMQMTRQGKLSGAAADAIGKLSSSWLAAFKQKEDQLKAVDPANNTETTDLLGALHVLRTIYEGAYQ